MKNNSFLAIIPARGGSKGIPGKNIKEIANKPLIAWTIEHAKKSRYINKLIVSTDDSSIAEVAKSFGCDVPFLRPKNLSTDESHRNEYIRHTLDKFSEYDHLVILQPTSPLRDVNHIDEAIDFYLNKKSPACVSVCEQKPSPHWMFSMKENKKLKPILRNPIFSRRQDIENFYCLNGAIFIINAKFFMESTEPDPFLTEQTIGFKMDALSSIDIDDQLDWFIAEKILNSRDQIII